MVDVMGGPFRPGRTFPECHLKCRRAENGYAGRYDFDGNHFPRIK